ncbi:MAG: GNAT family N-acetyltransferase [Clostridiales bacterium]|jgi:ribosomal protein S18 acetylase RimI-like enzyme|nr:GNAT family N-acetyltransferase [Clostridiales bacterium]
MNIKVRCACPKDGPEVIRLLGQIGKLHSEGRPDIYRDNIRKYSQAEFEAKIKSESEPVLVAVDEDDNVLGHVFGVLNVRENHPTMRDMRIMYIDDLCVDEACRGQGIGRALMNAICAVAKEMNCTKIDLNVWEFNTSAIKFYEACGMKTFRRHLELDI